MKTINNECMSNIQAGNPGYSCLGETAGGIILGGYIGFRIGAFFGNPLIGAGIGAVVGGVAGAISGCS